jgi:hypothetical protein
MGVFAGSPARGGSGASAASAFMQTIEALTTAAAVRAALGVAIGTDVQAQDAELAAMAALVSAANKLGYFTGSGAMSLTDFTAFARTILDDPDAATVLATIGAEPSDAELLAIAGLTSAANKLAYFTGSGTAALTDLSAFVRTLLDDADAATALATLGAQPSDTELTALAGLVSAANKLPYFTGAGSAALTDLSAFIRTLLDDADATTALATLGAQPLDTELTALAGLVSAANKLGYFTGSGTAALTDLTAAGRALIDDADASAQLTTLGVSTFIKTLLDDADAATARATLGVPTTIVALAADVTDSSGSPTDTGLSFTPAANSVYYVQVVMPFTSAATTTGFQFSFSGPTSGATYTSQRCFSANTQASEVSRFGAFDIYVGGNSVSSTSVTYLAVGEAVIVTSGSPSGNVTVKIETEVAASQVVARAGGFIRYTKIA